MFVERVKNLKLKSIAGGNSHAISTAEARNHYRTMIERQAYRPLPQHIFMQYVRTLADYDKLMLAIALQLPFTKKDLKKWPDLLFLKKLSTVIKKAATDTATKQQLLIHISTIMIDPSPPLTTIHNELQELITTRGYWKVYWTIFYHAERENNEELCNQMLEQLNDQFLNTSAESIQEVAATAQMTSSLISEQDRYEKKIAILEDKISKEIASRQQLELSGVQKDKLYRQSLQEQDKLLQQAKQLKEQLHTYEQQINRAQHIQQDMLQRKKEEEDRWLQERAQLLQQSKLALDEQKKLTLVQEQLQKELEESKKQVSQWQQTAQHRMEDVKPAKAKTTSELLHSAVISLHHEISKSNEAILCASEQSDKDYYNRSKEQRQHMLKTLQLIEQIEQYQFVKHEQEVKPQQTDSQQIEDANPMYGEQLHEKAAVVKSEAKDFTLSGTFYRRDHGGYISLENGEIFNITESLVQQLELQHEAEVRCTPTAHPGRSNHYTIELLFQGDDNFSPILQYDGYVQQDEEQKWYCVDMNNEGNCFPIHFKDIEIQKPAVGDPCTFNVAEDGHIARLTKLYRLHGEATDVHPARKKTDKPKESTPANTRQKLEPYLTGSTITIIGGQRKWFESVVKETGADLVHDGGERPERIASDLSRSQALFMILTSTSHRATWEGIEIAKANSIPHFVIQGSKSNLRMLLWENQELIRSTNRAV